MVLPVDEGDVHRCLGKPLRDTEASEAGADDNYARVPAVHAAGHELKSVLL